MADIRQIRRRIRTAHNIAQVTKTMQMIAASKMRRAQERGLEGRPYSEKISQVIADLAALPGAGELLHPLLERRPITRIGIVHIAPDRGLCGGLNTSLNRSLGHFILDRKLPVTIVAVGKKGITFAHRQGLKIQAEFSDLGERPSFLSTLPVSRVIMDDYIKGIIDAVYVSYARFISTMVQTPVIQQLLPVEPAVLAKGQIADFIFEPAASQVLGELLPRFVEMQVYHAILESIASEQSARMVAMRSATENARELIQELTLAYNKARQESITEELLDITAGTVAMS